jgi:hypothetical protein
MALEPKIALFASEFLALASIAAGHPPSGTWAVLGINASPKKYKAFYC